MERSGVYVEPLWQRLLLSVSGALKKLFKIVTAPDPFPSVQNEKEYTILWCDTNFFKFINQEICCCK